MKTIKRLIFPLLSAFLLYRTIEDVSSLMSAPEAQFGNFALFVFAFLITLYVTGIFAFVGFVFPTNRLLPNAYYTIKNPVVLTKTYDALGVKYFRNILMLVFWGKKDKRQKYFNGTRAGLKNFVYQTKQSEFGHLGALIVVFLLAILMMFSKLYALAIMITVINIIGNFYPIILQRHHRIRISKMIV